MSEIYVTKLLITHGKICVTSEIYVTKYIELSREFVTRTNRKKFDTTSVKNIGTSLMSSSG